MTYEELKAAYEAAVQKCSELEKENDELKKSNEDKDLHIEHLEEQIALTILYTKCVPCAD